MRRTPRLNLNWFVTSSRSLAVGAGFILLPAISAVVSPTTASAQVSEVTPYYVEVTVENAYLRCGDGEPWYAVGRVPNSTLLRVDGEGFGWLRVAYPGTVGALLRTDEATLTDAGAHVRLTRPSALRAYNLSAGVSNSWKRLLSKRATTGTQLAVLETITDDDNAVSGFIVSPPDSARAFIAEKLVRRLTPDQAAQRLNAINPIAATNTPAVSADTTPQSTIENTPAQAPEIARTDTNDAAPTTNAFSPDTPARSATPSQTTPVVLTLEPTDDMVGQRLLTLAELHEAFQRVFLVPILESELQPLIDEHRAVLSDFTSSDADQSSRRFLESQIQLLEIRLEVQSRLDQIADVESSASQEREQFEATLNDFNSNPTYALAGRLATSAIYDGTTLPRLYRLLSIEDGSNRTIGYLAPNPDLDLDAKLGSIVGIVGSERLRNTGAYRASVLTATRVDVLRP